MKTLNLPTYHFTIREEGKKTKIFGEIRKKFLVLTPEEWVRQNVLRFLIEEQNFPRGLIAVEKGLTLNGLKKRTDILIYNKQGLPIMMVECKAPEVSINQSAFDQIGRYNMTFKLPYLMVTNGMIHYCAKINFETNQFLFLNEIPTYETLV